MELAGIVHGRDHGIGDEHDRIGAIRQMSLNRGERFLGLIAEDGIA